MTISFTLQRPSDTATLLRMMAEFYAFDGRTFNEQLARKALTEIRRNTNLGRVWLIHSDEEAVGYLSLVFTFSLEAGGRIAEIDEIYINGEARNQGIGGQTLQWLDETMKHENIPYVYLEVNRRNADAQRFYKAAGYRARERHLGMGKVFG